MTSQRAMKQSSDLQRLAEWLRCWQLHLALGEGEPLPLVARTAPPAGPEGTPVEIGQVRLLKPAGVMTARRPWFVAVLDRAAPKRCWIVPFSALPLPAFETELQLSSRRPSYVRTLCLWNARQVHDHTLARASWICGQLSAAELRAARAVWRTWRGIAPLPRTLRDRVGPPLVHPRDPRRDYEAAEASAWDETTASLEEPQSSGADHLATLYTVPDAARLLAAESDDDPQPSSKGTRT